MKNNLRITSFVIVSLMLNLTISCKKEPVSETPTVKTEDATNITATSVLCEGKITADGAASIISRGFCWSTNQYPTILDNKTSGGGEVGSFTGSITGLRSATIYYIRAYATNSIGIGYGNQVTATTLASSTVTDIDGNVYNTVTIGTQTWMKENLKTTKYRNGNSIGTTTPATLDISNGTTYPNPKYQWPSGGNESNVATYGRLYTWYAVTDSRNVCPTGWHVPTDSEWTTLTTFLGGESEAGGQLKEAGTSHWLSPNTGATNSSGFTALPGGYRYYYGSFNIIGFGGYWWSSTEFSTHYAWRRTMAYFYSYADRVYDYRTLGFSVRCLRDMV